MGNMNFKTTFNKLPTNEDWVYVKNLCRSTDNKEFTEKEPTVNFKKKLLISEHSPIRELVFGWTWKDIFYWVSTEWSRHKFEKYISSQRDDRLIDAIPRGEKPQNSLVAFRGSANMQSKIDAWRKRLCYMATPEARGLAESDKVTLHETHPLEADVLVPNCIYRCGCPEFKPCGYFNAFMKHLENKYPNTWMDVLYDIQERYNEYNEWFYLTHKKENY